jgi:hypothetical protein
MHQAWRRNQDVVVGKTPPPAEGLAEVLQSPRSARQLSCCLQAEPPPSQPAKSVPRIALGPELRCCWQDGAAAASGPEPSVAGGYAPLWRDASRDAVASSRDCGRATCAGYPDIPRDIPGRWRTSLCGNRCAVVAGNRARRIPFGGAGTSMAGSSSGNSGNAFHP